MWTPIQESTLGGYWDHRDVSAGAVTSWTSRDAVGTTIYQSDATRQPVKSADGVAFDGSNDSLALSVSSNATQAKLRGLAPLPDRITCTGIARAPSGNWWVADFGDASLGAETGPYIPKLFEYAADPATGGPHTAAGPLSTINLTSLYSGMTGIQGVVWDKSDGTLWVADEANRKIRHLTPTGAALGDEITVPFVPNGLARDHANDLLWVAEKETGGTTNMALASYSCATGALVTAPYQVVLTGRDHLFFDDASRSLMISYGRNGETAYVAVYHTSGAAAAPLVQIGLIKCPAEVDAVEGIYYTDRKLHVASDGYYHRSSSRSGVNRIVTLDVTPPAAKIVDFALVARAQAQSATTALLVSGDPLVSATHGWGLYKVGQTELRLFANAGITGTTGQASLAVTGTPSLASDRIIHARVDLVAGSLSIWVDGVSVGTVAAANVVGCLGAGRALSMASAPPGRWSNLTIKAACYFMRNAGDADPRVKAEGYLAAAFGLQGNLPADHPYRTDAPRIA